MGPTSIYLLLLISPILTAIYASSAGATEFSHYSKSKPIKNLSKEL
jgi:hypothetical protein